MLKNCKKWGNYDSKYGILLEGEANKWLPTKPCANLVQSP